MEWRCTGILKEGKPEGKMPSDLPTYAQGKGRGGYLQGHSSSHLYFDLQQPKPSSFDLRRH